MKFTLPALLIIVAGLLLQPGQASGQSLWEQRDQRKAFLFQDLKARCVGDILAVVISENTDVANSDSRGLNKSSAAEASGGFSWSGNSSSGSGDANVESASRRAFDGETNFSSDRQFLDHFSVTVIDVLPNGNLVVSGCREILVEGDTRKLELSGIVRESDIRPDNSVLSRNVAQLKILYTGDGVESAFVNQGFLGRFFNKVWPF
jgi:flagellar L-ring protein precursor FlgH